MDIDFPVEFIVLGTPVSHQRANTRAKHEWKRLVRQSSVKHLQDVHFARSRQLAVTLFYFPQERMIGDLDNIVKLTLDAMSRHIYLDDEQIERIVVQKFERDRLFDFTNPSRQLATCMLGAKPALYVRVSDDPFEELRR